MLPWIGSSLKLRTRGKNMQRASQVTRRIALQAAGMAIALITVLAVPAITPAQGYTCRDREDICEQNCSDRCHQSDERCQRLCTDNCWRKFHCDQIGPALKRRGKAQADCDSYQQCTDGCDCSDVPPKWTCDRWKAACKRSCRMDNPGWRGCHGKP